MPRIVTIRSKDESDTDVVSLVFSQDAVSLGPDGDPWCGVTLNPAQARSLAQRLTSFAVEIERQEQPGHRTSSRALNHLVSAVVVHDGSQAGHRAFEAALELANRCFASLDFIGIFGIDSQTSEASTAQEDFDWQRGWLSRLTEMYTEEAAGRGVAFTSVLFPANDACGLLDTLYRMDADLIVIPKSLSRFGVHGERLIPSIIHRNSNVLVCP